MKKIKFVILVIFLTLFFGCERFTFDPNIDLSEEIQKMVPKRILEDLRSKGMTINEGRFPPDIEGSYYVTPYELLSPYGPEDSWEKGRVISSYHYRFSDQSEDNQRVLVDYYSEGNNRGSGEGAVIAGNGNKFTIFSEVSGKSNGVKYVELKIISGEITASKEIKDFQCSLYMKKKNESDGPKRKLIPKNTGRTWIDGDRISPRTSKFSGTVNPSLESDNMESDF